MYKNGLGVPVDKNDAVVWLFLSTEQGNASANYALDMLILKVKLLH